MYSYKKQELLNFVTIVLMYNRELIYSFLYLIKMLYIKVKEWNSSNCLYKSTQFAVSSLVFENVEFYIKKKEKEKNVLGVLRNYICSFWFIKFDYLFCDGWNIHEIEIFDLIIYFFMCRTVLSHRQFTKLSFLYV